MAFSVYNSDRGHGTALLLASNANIDGAQNILHALPATVDADVWLLEVQIEVASIATMMSNPELAAVQVRLRDTQQQNIADIVDTPLWRKHSTTGVVCMARPDRPVLWRIGEFMNVIFQEVDTNASPTADINIWAIVQRQAVARARAGLRLTR